MKRAGVSDKTAMDISGLKTRAIFDRHGIVDEADPPPPGRVCPKPTLTATGEADAIFCSNYDPSRGSSPSWAGSTALFNCRDNGITTLTKTGGGTFILNSIDLAPFDTDSPSYGVGASVTFTGTKSDLSTVQATFTVPLTLQFATYSFTGFDNLESVRWQHVWPYHQFDNITLDGGAAPEPATAVLLAAGLALGVLARCKRRQAGV